MVSFFTQPKLLFTLVLASYFVFGLHHLTQFVTADEHYWVYERIPQYWDAVASGKWKKTFINDKPGVTLALVSGVGYLIHPDAGDHCTEQKDKTLLCDTKTTETLYRDFRLPILIVNALLLIVLFWIIGRLSGSWTALFTVTLTGLSPILLGASQILNPDSLLWSFGAAALFSFFALLRFEEKKFIFLTLFFLAFAILSKYVAIILIPLFLTILLFRFLSSDDAPETLRALLKKDTLSFFLITAGTGALVCLFLPALLVDQKYLAELIMTVPDKEVLASLGGFFLLFFLIDTFLLHNKFLLLLRRFPLSLTTLLRFFGVFFGTLFLGIIVVRVFFPDWSIFTAIAFDIKDLSDARYYTDIPNFFESFLLEWNPIVFSLTPVVLIGFFVFIWKLFQKEISRASLVVTSLFFFFLIYTVLLIYSNILTSPRYSIMLYPLFAYLAALGFHALAKKIASTQKNVMMFFIVFIGSLASLIASSPFYFNYTNHLLPKNALIQDAWGYGGYEAAQYLNSLPDAKGLTVWADYYGVCEFFVGKCLTAYTFDKETIRPDYYVLTRRGKTRYLSRSPRWERLSGLTAYRYYGIEYPDWELHIGDRPGNFIKVVKVKNDE